MAVTINYKFASTIAGLFRDGESDEYPQLFQAGISWSNNNVLNRFTKCDLSGPEFEVPVAIRGYAERVLRATIGRTFSSIGEKELVVPIIQQSYINNKRTADSILNELFESTIQYGMVNIKTNKDIEYHGGRGYIFDANFNPIFFATLIGHYDVEDVSNRVKGWTWTECRVYLHPNIIIDGSDLIGKSIMKKVLPYLLSSRDVFPYSGIDWIKISENIKVKVIIEDVSRFFRTPTPMRADFTNEEMNEMLAAHADEVVRQLKL